MTGGRHKPNMELIAQGIGNIGSALFGGIPATGAIARTATNIKAGAKSPVSGMIHALTLLAILMAFAHYAQQIPLAVLAGILTVVCYNMSEIHTFSRLLKGPRQDAAVLVITFLLTVFVDLVVAVEVGVVLAALLFMAAWPKSAMFPPSKTNCWKMMRKMMETALPPSWTSRKAWKFST